jgi:hypothetical protein
MDYVCLVYLDEKKLQALSADEAAELNRVSLDYDAELRRRGHYVTSRALQPVSAATTVRVRNGRRSATDGPYAETREQLGGFILIEARDLDEAIQVAAGIPVAKFGCVEVRPAKTIG